MILGTLCEGPHKPGAMNALPYIAENHRLEELKGYTCRLFSAWPSPGIFTILWISGLYGNKLKS